MSDRLGRAARGLAAALAMAVTALAALVLLAWSCCSTPSLASRLSDPLLWCLAAAGAVALAAFPPVTQWLRARGVRWSLSPFVLADLVLCAWLGWEVAQALPRGDANTDEAMLFLLPVLAPNAVCAVYVGWRLVLAPAVVRGPLAAAKTEASA
jgi:hypothetical protein